VGEANVPDPFSRRDIQSHLQYHRDIRLPLHDPYLMKGIVVVLAAGATLPATDAVGSATTPAQPLAVGLIGLLTVAVGFLGAWLYLRRRHI
jgi:hypothetical protein